MDKSVESKERLFLSNRTFKSEIETYLQYFKTNIILEMRFALPIGLIISRDKDVKNKFDVGINWIDEKDAQILQVLSCMEFEISCYEQQGFRMAFSQKLTPYKGLYFDPSPGFEYYLKKNKDAVIEKIITDMKHFEPQLREFVQHCNLFYHLHCKPYIKL